MTPVKAIQITEFGGPEKLEPVELPDPIAKPGQVVVEIVRTGVNFADTHATRDHYLASQTLPLVPGLEFTGLTADGRRVAGVVPSGAYAEAIAVDEDRLVEIPDGVDDETAAALLVQGLTADAILRVSGRFRAGQSVVVNAAAGGTGSLCVQIARAMGAGRVIGLASSPEKREMVERLGADVAIDSTGEDLTGAVLAANRGEPVDLVLEMAGGPAFDQLIETVAPFGCLVTFGIASGEPNTVRTQDLMRSSRSVAGFWINHLFERPEMVREGLERVLSAAASGEIETVIGGVRPLSEARSVHEQMASRRTVGKMLLDPKTG
ncbi:MAG: quinone oxidoreductase family protein [Solirubrobacterales bacterium]